MARTIALGVVARFIVFYVVWPMLMVALGAMGVSPDWFWTLVLGPTWKEIVPTYLTQDTARWLTLIAGVLVGLGFVAYAVRRRTKLPSDLTLTAESKLQSPRKLKKEISSGDAPFELKLSFQDRNDAAGVIHVHTLLWNIKHHEKGMLRIESAFISSLVTGEPLSLMRAVNGTNIDPSAGDPIPPDAYCFLLANFTGDTRGLSVADFLNRWGGFSLTIEFSINMRRSTFTKRYEYDWVRQSVIDRDPNYRGPMIKRVATQ